MMDTDPAAIAVFVGIDVGKATHYAVALDRAGKRLMSRGVPNDEAQLRGLLTTLQQRGAVLVAIDQPASIGALVVAVAQAMGIAVGYLPGLTMRRLADLHPGEAKTDARDALVIAETARTLPHTLRALRRPDEALAELRVLSGFDDDVRQQLMAPTNRLRGLLVQIHPALERVLGPRLDHPAVLEVLQRSPTPQALAALGERRLATRLTGQAPRLAAELARTITEALTQQTVVVAGTAAAGQGIARGGATGLAPPAAGRVGRPGRRLGGRAPSFPRAALLAGRRERDRSTTPDRSHRTSLSQRRPAGVLCRAGPGHPAIGTLPQGRTGRPWGQQAPQARLVCLGRLGDQPSVVQAVLPAQASRREEPCARGARVGAAPGRRALRDGACYTSPTPVPLPLAA